MWPPTRGAATAFVTCHILDRLSHIFSVAGPEVSLDASALPLWCQF